jgi:hypothetical protein
MAEDRVNLPLRGQRWEPALAPLALAESIERQPRRSRFDHRRRRIAFLLSAPRPSLSIPSAFTAGRSPWISRRAAKRQGRSGGAQLPTVRGLMSIVGS